jgi:hydrogenase expression/formation protein HypE
VLHITSTEGKLSTNSERILLAHGSGGKLSQELVDKIIVDAIGNPILARMDDSAVIDLPGKTAFTTDSYVVSPIFFPGGDIGRLAICGTVNDLATAGATPLYLSLSFIIEEGLLLSEFEQILRSIKETAEEAGVLIVTGDTKVVNKNGADKLFINTSGLGKIPDGLNISGHNARIGDKIILSGTIGDHGIAIMSKREGLQFEASVISDCAPLNHLVAEILQCSPNVHCLRDPTRGGLATTLNEIAQQSSVGIEIEETTIPVGRTVRGACEMLGLDPLYIANEGKMVIIVAPEDAPTLLDGIRMNCYGQQSALIGEVVAGHPGRVVMRTNLEASRFVDIPMGELLPRIC